MTDEAFIRVSQGRASVDWRQKPSTLISNSLLLEAMQRFLCDRWSSDSPGDHVLDLGAGLAPYAPVYRPYFHHATTVDVRTLPTRRTASMSSQARTTFRLMTRRSTACPAPRFSSPAPILSPSFSRSQRVLTPGGAAFLTTPFLVGVHEAPHDFYRYTPFALRDLAAKSGFDVVWIDERGDYGAVALSMLQYPLTLFWSFTAARTRPSVYSAANPIVPAGRFIGGRNRLIVAPVAGSGPRPVQQWNRQGTPRRLT